MLKRLSLALVALLVILPVSAGLITAPSRHSRAVIVCPMGSGFPTDGCAGANQGAYWQQANAFQVGGYFNTVAGTTANYMAATCGPSANQLCRPPWNVAGVDYPIGHYTSCDINNAGTFKNCGSSTAVCTDTTWTSGRCLIDPQLHPPTGCTVVANGISGSSDKQLNCNQNTFVGPVSHYNFGPVNGHDCTGIWISNAGNQASLAMDDIYYFNNSGACATSISNDNLWMVINGNPYASGVTITNSTIDFNNSQWDTQFGPCASGVRCNGWFMSLGFNNPVTLQYVAILNDPAAPILGGPRDSSGGIVPVATYQYDFFQSWISRAPNGHKELYAAQNAVSPSTDPGNTIGGFVFDHSVAMNNANATTSFGPAEFWTANTYGLNYASGPQLTNNTFIQAHVGNRPAVGGVTFTGCLGNSYSGGCVTGATNNILFITSESAPLGYGASLNCTGVSGSTYKQIPGPYPAGVVEEYGFDGLLAAQYYPTWTAFATATPCSGTAFAEEVSNGALIGSHGAAPYGSPVLQNNYMDISSFANGGTTPAVWNFSEVDITPNPVSIASGSISGNTLTTSTSVSLEQGLYVYAADIPGCSTSMHDCPRVDIGGTGTTFTLDTTLGSPVSAEAMQAWNLTWCTTPAVLSGNRDMTGSIADSWLNQLSSTQSGSGC